MVFCSTRSIAATTAKNLAKWWSSKQLHQAFWNSPSRRIGVLNNDLKGTGNFSHEFRKILVKDFLFLSGNHSYSDNHNMLCLGI